MRGTVVPPRPAGIPFSPGRRLPAPRVERAAGRGVEWRAGATEPRERHVRGAAASSSATLPDMTVRS